jgi:hypothetical protein
MLFQTREHTKSDDRCTHNTFSFLSIYINIDVCYHNEWMELTVAKRHSSACHRHIIEKKTEENKIMYINPKKSKNKNKKEKQKINYRSFYTS